MANDDEVARAIHNLREDSKWHPGGPSPSVGIVLDALVSLRGEYVALCTELTEVQADNERLKRMRIAVGGHEDADMGEVSDGFHTFNELYEHRSLLFMALMAKNPCVSWFAPYHEDGTMYPGFFVAGIDSPNGQITYPLKIDPYWRMLAMTRCTLLAFAPQWDGHTSVDILERLRNWLDTLMLIITNDPRLPRD